MQMHDLSGTNAVSQYLREPWTRVCMCVYVRVCLRCTLYSG